MWSSTSDGHDIRQVPCRSTGWTKKSPEGLTLMDIRLVRLYKYAKENITFLCALLVNNNRCLTLTIRKLLIILVRNNINIIFWKIDVVKSDIY